MFARNRRRSTATPTSSPICRAVSREKSDTGRQSVRARSDRKSVSPSPRASRRAGSSTATTPPEGVSTSTASSAPEAKSGVTPGAKPSASVRLTGRAALAAIPEARAIEEHLFPLARGEVGKALGTVRPRESEKAVAVNAGVAEVGLLQLLAAHALDRKSP